MKPFVAPLAIVLMVACAGSPPRPVTIDVHHDVCAHCRMVISTPTTAAQLLIPGEEPVLFDDLACLREFAGLAPVPADALVFVADHLSGDWLRLEDAIVSEIPGLQTPMGGGLVAHRSTADRDRDPAARGGRPYDATLLRGGRQP